MQTVAGLACIVFGVLHFVDRDRSHPQARSFYFNVLPRTPPVRSFLALAEVGLGGVLLLAA